MNCAEFEYHLQILLEQDDLPKHDPAEDCPDGHSPANVQSTIGDGLEPDRSHRVLRDGSSLPSRFQPLRQHAAECAACGQQWEAVCQLAEAIDAWRQPLLSVDLADRIVAAYLDPASFEPSSAQAAGRSSGSPAGQAVRRTAGQDGVPAGSWHTLAIVAASLAALVMFMLRPTRLADPARDHTALVPGDRAVPAPSRGPTPGPAVASAEVQDLVRHAGTAWLALAQDAAGTVNDAASLVLPSAPAETRLEPVVIEPALIDPSVIGAHVDGIFVGGSGSSTGIPLKPIGESVGEAFHFLWGAAGGGDNPAT